MKVNCYYLSQTDTFLAVEFYFSHRSGFSDSFHLIGVEMKGNLTANNLSCISSLKYKYV